ncbi:MAG: respiratory nitrate reductase subunit gamma [Bacillota bacterium]
MSYIILQILPYITVIVFTVGILYRLGRWAGPKLMPNVILSPFPRSEAQRFGVIGAEVIFFRSLFSSDRALWVGAWLMHIALFMAIGGHVVGIYFLGKQFIYLGVTETMSENLSVLLGTSAGLLLLAGLLYLLIRRVSIPKVKEVSSPSDYLHLVLLLTIVVIGNIMRLWEHSLGIAYEPVKDYVTQLITFKPLPLDHEVLKTPLFVLHLLFVQILLMILPFSKLMHIPGMFAERWIINRVYKEPAPGLPNVDIEAARRAGIGLPSGEGGV